MESVCRGLPVPKVSIPADCNTSNEEEVTENTLRGLRILLVVLLSMLSVGINWGTWSPNAG